MDPPTPFPRTLLITGALAADDIPELCERARLMLAVCNRLPLVCDVGEVVACDAVVLDALAHLKLVACRHGSEMRIVRASEDLEDLIALAGLSEVLKVGRA